VWTELRSGVSRFVPQGLRRLWRRRQIEMIRRNNQGRDVADIFSEIYRDARWGGERGSFHSGSGSTSGHAESYAQVIKAFIKQHNVRRLVDLGCGDFRVGAQLIGADITYTGIDIVPSLVESNQRMYGSERVGFECMNIIDDELPDGDLCLVRQVLQHLSNEQIIKVLKNSEKYRYVIVTEHHPAPGALRHRNLDKPCGQDVRIYDGSAVFLDAPPFNRRVVATLADVDAGHYLMRPGERIRTQLIENEQS
jgi:SAM-dependent methyltransferase